MTTMYNQERRVRTLVSHTTKEYVLYKRLTVFLGSDTFPCRFEVSGSRSGRKEKELVVFNRNTGYILTVQQPLKRNSHRFRNIPLHLPTSWLYRITIKRRPTLNSLPLIPSRYHPLLFWTIFYLRLITVTLSPLLEFLKTSSHKVIVDTDFFCFTKI